MPSMTAATGDDRPLGSTSGGRAATALQAHLLLAVACLPILGMLVIAPVLPDMQRHFGTVEGVEYLIPLALTAPSVMIVLLSPFAGRIAARFGRRRVLLAALILYLVTATAPLWLSSLWAILASRLLVGVAEAMLMTVSTMLLGDYFEPRRRDRYLGIQVIYTSVSAVIFLVLGGMLGEAGWRVPFAAYSVTLLVIPLVFALIWEPAAPLREQVEGLATAPVPWKSVVPICLVTFVAGGCMNLVSVDLGFLLETVGTMGSTMKGVGAALNSAGIAVGAATFAIIAGRDRIWHVVVAFIIAALGYALMAKGPGSVGVISGGALAGAASGFYLGWLSAAINRPLVYSNRGRVVGLWMSSYFLATVIAPALAVALAGPFGGLRNAMLAFGGALLVLALLSPSLLRIAGTRDGGGNKAGSAVAAD